MLLNINWNQHFLSMTKAKIQKKIKNAWSDEKNRQELINPQKINASFKNNVQNTNLGTNEVCLLFFLNKPIKLAFVVVGTYVSVEENIDIALNSRKFKYEYYLGKVYLCDNSVPKNRKMIGVLTKKGFICKYDTGNYQQIAEQIEDKYAKKNVRSKNKNKAVQKMAEQIRRNKSFQLSIDEIKENILKEAKFSICKEIRGVSYPKNRLNRSIFKDSNFVLRNLGIGLL